jgi:hypothetical protein
MTSFFPNATASQLLQRLLLFFVPAVIFGYDLQFFITSAGGYSEYFTTPNGTRFGMTFQNPVYTKKGGERIGTNQGYSIWFPEDPFMMEHHLIGGNDTGESVGALFKMPTRTFYLAEGTITGVNEAIVGATGAYTGFEGGRMIENATGTDPYEAEIYCVLPVSTSLRTSSARSAPASFVGMINIVMSTAWIYVLSL